MSEIIDRGSWLAGVLAVLIVSAGFFATVNQKLDEVYRIPNLYEYFDHTYDEGIDPAATQAKYERSQANFDNAMAARHTIPVVGDRFFNFFTFNPTAFYQPLLAISLFYVPFLILLMSIFGGFGSFGILLRRDYGTLATCTLMAWAAAHLPFAIAGIALYSQAVNPSVYFALWVASSVIFGAFMVFALRTVFGSNFGPAILAVCVGWIAFSAAMYVFQYVSPWLLSPSDIRVHLSRRIHRRRGPRFWERIPAATKFQPLPA